jgi:hypothetical protein
MQGCNCANAILLYNNQLKAYLLTTIDEFYVLSVRHLGLLWASSLFIAKPYPGSNCALLVVYIRSASFSDTNRPIHSFPPKDACTSDFCYSNSKYNVSKYTIRESSGNNTVSVKLPRPLRQFCYQKQRAQIFDQEVNDMI